MVVVRLVLCFVGASCYCGPRVMVELCVGWEMNVKKVVDVVTGSLVLFPASLTHFTIPFESEEERIVLAFDLKQKTCLSFLRYWMP